MSDGGPGAPAAPGRHVPPRAGLSDAAEGRLPYPVWIGEGALDGLGAIVAAHAPAHRLVLITDTTVAGLHADRVRATLAPIGEPLVLQVPPGESEKTRGRWAELTDAMLAAGCARDTTVIALGGGVVGDLAGFVAATFMRGVPVVQVPTTLLAMVDASVGGKTAVDTPAGKNLVGAFHPPAAVVIDSAVLVTLPGADLLAGAAESVKHGVIADTAYFHAVAELLPSLSRWRPASTDGRDRPAWLASLTGVVARSVAIKASVVAHDEREGGMRKILNFGHTLGHALESESGFALRHGEAVAAGMALEARLAERLGLAEPGTATTVAAALDRVGLPSGRPTALDPEAVLAATRGDKKSRAGVVEYALPRRIGAMEPAGGRWAVPVPDALVREVLAPAWHAERRA
ncbi:3-dehydroquinate synthase [Roseisolibacter agri]|uniref:3-dehydroquinate synthase n=1 Tax=Roseisolibacter agri TaxID=2014610 RepID=A0AA37QM95_9BACT|nr:3-dehydroquinate synthase [Roseisolibacter agri]GLC28448.1 3-dehydroquinate synthase [Roseisolibacter agri]